jgi:hypothetical protein
VGSRAGLHEALAGWAGGAGRTLRELPSLRLDTHAGPPSFSYLFSSPQTYNYGKSSYDLGEGFGHFGIAAADVDKMVEAVKAAGGLCQLGGCDVRSWEGEWLGAQRWSGRPICSNSGCWPSL